MKQCLNCEGRSAPSWKQDEVPLRLLLIPVDRFRITFIRNRRERQETAICNRADTFTGGSRHRSVQITLVHCALQKQGGRSYRAAVKQHNRPATLRDGSQIEMAISRESRISLQKFCGHSQRELAAYAQSAGLSVQTQPASIRTEKGLSSP